MKFKIYLAITLLLILSININLNAQSPSISTSASILNDHNNANGPELEHLLYLPRLTPECELQTRLDFSFVYDEATEQAAWVAYALNTEMISGQAMRKNDFRPDPNITTGSASLADYRKSGYDRGHLAPSADMRRNEATQSASFFMSNMSPQLPGFNRGIWNRLEGWVRRQVQENATMLVVTGPYFKNEEEFKTIGENEVGIPTGYFKALVELGKTPRAIAFYLPHESSSAPLTDFVLSVDELEEIIDFDLFCSLEGSIEGTLEATYTLSQWLF